LFCEIEELYNSIRDYNSANIKITNEENKRINERAVRKALKLVQIWRDTHKAANERLAKGMHHISLLEI